MQNSLQSETIDHQKIRRIIDSIPNPVVFYNSRGEILMYNSAFLKSFSCLFLENNNNQFYRLFNDKNLEYQKETDNQVFKNISQTVEFESQIKFCDSMHESFCLFTKVPIFNDDSNKIDGILCVIRDISQLKKKHQNQLMEKQKELAYLRLRVNNISLFNKNLIDKVSRLEKFLNKQGKEQLQEILENHQYELMEGLMDEFEKQILEINPDFFTNLKKKHPDLSPFERKICSYLKLNMTTKEIANLTLSTAKSIEMGRYRLRQKLGIPSSVNLSNYISQF